MIKEINMLKKMYTFSFFVLMREKPKINGDITMKEDTFESNEAAYEGMKNRNFLSNGLSL